MKTVGLICLPTGAVEISFATMQGSLTKTEMKRNLAQPGEDFHPVNGSIVLQDGQTSTSIPIRIIDVSNRSCKIISEEFEKMMKMTLSVLGRQSLKPGVPSMQARFFAVGF